MLCDSPFPDRLLALTLLAFEGLGTAAGKDQCLACLEEAFFPPLWAPLLALYRYRDPLWRVRDPLPPSWHTPIMSVPSGPCSSPVRRPWRAAWSGTGMPAPPTWGWLHASSHPPLAVLHTPPPCRTCASSHWRRVRAGSWSASVSGSGDGGRGSGGGSDPDASPVPQCEPCVASASVPRSTAAPGTPRASPRPPCEYGNYVPRPDRAEWGVRGRCGAGGSCGRCGVGAPVPVATMADKSLLSQRGRRPAAHPVLRGAADGVAPAALRVHCPGGVHP